MKRNHPPDDSENLQDEQEIIDSRLNELFSQPSRSIPITSKGYWMEDHRHVKVESLKGTANELLSFSSASNYHYLNLFEALYCLETSQLIIFFNGIPLSLAEAYQILLENPMDFRNYRVFQQLNRSGYICLKPNNNQTSTSDRGTASGSTRVTSNRLHPSDDYSEPPLKIEYSTPIPDKVLMALRSRGPCDYKTDFNLGSQQKDILKDVVFDVYKRETFVKNKPRKDKFGKPDYKLIICDKSSDKAPNVKQLVCYDEKKNETEGHKLIFASIDDDSSICFSYFKCVNSEELELF